MTQVVTPKQGSELVSLSVPLEGGMHTQRRVALVNGSRIFYSNRVSSREGIHLLFPYENKTRRLRSITIDKQSRA